MATFTSFRCLAAAFNSGGTYSVVAREFSGSKLSPGDPLDNRFYGRGFYPVHETTDQSTSPESGAGRGARSESGENQAGNSRRLAAGSSVTLQTARGSGERAIVPVRARHEQHRHSHHGYSVFWEARSPLHHSRGNSVLLQDLLRLALA